jgi:hypothetical protein
MLVSQHDFLITTTVIAQIIALSNAATSQALSYYRYSHPRAAMLDFKGAYPILRQIYATHSHMLMFIWHHLDLLTFLFFSIAFYCAGEKMIDAVLVTGTVISVALTIYATKVVLQLRMIDLLLPCLIHGKTDRKEVKKYIRPIGSIAFGMTASAASQSMFLIGWAFCTTFKSEHTEFYLRLLKTLILTGILVNASARIVSWTLMLHPVESSRCGKNL